MATKTDEALEVDMINLVKYLITNISEHVMQNDVSKQLWYTEKYDGIQPRGLFNLESICAQAYEYVISSLQKHNKMTTTQMYAIGIQVLW